MTPEQLDHIDGLIEEAQDDAPGFYHLGPETVAALVDLRREHVDLRELLADLYDDEPCSYDHHGYCQSHGLSEKQCVMERVRAALTKDQP